MVEVAVFTPRENDREVHEPAEPLRRLPLRPVVIAGASLVAVAVTAVGAYAFWGDRGHPVGSSQVFLDRTAPSGPPESVEATPTATPTETPTVTAAPTTGAPTSRTAPPRRTTAPPTFTSVEASVVALVNKERAKAGCPAVTADNRLALAARRHSADMAARGYFSHDAPDGTTMADRVNQTGYRWSALGENIAKGQPTAAEVMRAWMTSPGHQANIVNCGYRHIGVGLAYDARHTPLWTQDFATPR